MQRLWIQFRGARFENMIPQPPGVHVPIVWADPGAYRWWQGWKLSATVAWNALQRPTVFSTESINLSLAVMWSPGAVSLQKNPNHFHISSSCLFGLLKATPKPTIFHTWKESLGSRPTKHPPQNLFLFVLHLFAVWNHLNQNHGRPWLSSHRKPRSSQEHLLLVMLPFPASGGSASLRPSSLNILEIKGNTHPHGVCLYLHRSSRSLRGIFPLVLTPFFPVVAVYLGTLSCSVYFFSSASISSFRLPFQPRVQGPGSEEIKQTQLLPCPSRSPLPEPMAAAVQVEAGRLWGRGVNTHN